tara:strand:- start:1225 stop:1923 length:699 start_codon:yes stop_codon:yes gene_type:complete
MKITKKIISIVCILILSVCLTSCVKIIEKFIFKKDGSGTYSMSIDMSEVADMLKSIGGGADEEIIKGMDELEVEFEEKIERIESISGVSNGRKDFDKEKLKYTILFDFADMDALNRGMSESYRDSTAVGPTKQTVFFTQKGNSFERTDINETINNFKKGLEMEGDEEFDLDMAAIMFGDAAYEQIIEFDTKIKSVSNDEYELSEDNKSVSWIYRLFQKEDYNKKPRVKIVIR